jgi:dihydrofolate reductase
MHKFIIIACLNKKRAIGKNGKLLYHINNDINNFSMMTKHNGVVIMGRKTFESLPGGKPLPDRINIVLTSDVEWGVEASDNLYIVNSIEDAVELCEAFFSDKELFVIGGESVYRQFIENDLVDEMRLTIVNDETEGDTHFPEFNKDEWNEYYMSMAQVSNWEYKETTFYFQILKKK